MNPIEVMVTSNLPAAFTTGLQKHFTVHHREHIRDPAVLARVKALVCAEHLALGRELMGLLPNLKLICVLGDDASLVDAKEALLRGIVVLKTRDVHSQDMADFAMGLLISSVRRMAESERVLRNGDWVDGPILPTGRLHGRRLGLVGFGPVGKALTQRALGFGLSVAYCDAAPQEAEVVEVTEQARATYYPTTLELAQQVDFLVLTQHAAIKACGAVDAAVLQALGPEGHLVNLLNGADLVDEAALVSALQSRQLGGAALDGFAEPPRVGPAIRQAKGSLLTPGMACNTQAAVQDACDQVLLQLQTFFAPTAT
ncbi:MAG: Glyoxylate/hydroxypyruvate reductase [Pseudomonadota bacterium]|jgi:lactate dehydrogenase-like 2-hydroxyacid dehydrogenase